MADNSEDYQKRTERIKALLSSYYGADAAAGGAQPGPGGQQPAARAGPSAGAPGIGPGSALLPSIDTANFNADQHTHSVLRSYPLEKLMIEHRNMAREIKNLDGDMQQLVYENYNKFITATDTIRSMKQSLDSMDGELERLQSTAGRGDPLRCCISHATCHCGSRGGRHAHTGV